MELVIAPHFLPRRRRRAPEHQQRAGVRIDEDRRELRAACVAAVVGRAERARRNLLELALAEPAATLAGRIDHEQVVTWLIVAHDQRCVAILAALAIAVDTGDDHQVVVVLLADQIEIDVALQRGRVVVDPDLAVAQRRQVVAPLIQGDVADARVVQVALVARVDTLDVAAPTRDLTVRNLGPNQQLAALHAQERLGAQAHRVVARAVDKVDRLGVDGGGDEPADIVDVAPHNGRWWRRQFGRRRGRQHAHQRQDQGKEQRRDKPPGASVVA